MKYYYSDYWILRVKEIAQELGMKHVDLDRLSVIVSKGSKSRRTLARIHSLGKVMQTGMKQEKSFYTIELVSENFSKQNNGEKTKTLIHELLHIPASFGGGFRHHKIHVTHKHVDKAFDKLASRDIGKKYT